MGPRAYGVPGLQNYCGFLRRQREMFLACLGGCLPWGSFAKPASRGCLGYRIGRTGGRGILRRLWWINYYNLIRDWSGSRGRHPEMILVDSLLEFDKKLVGKEGEASR